VIRQLLPERMELEGPEAVEGAYLPPGDRHLRINFVATLDGAVEVGGRSGPLGGPVDRSAFMAMRAVADVVLVGAGTARAEDYGPVRLAPEVQARRRARGQSSLPPLAVVTATGALEPGSRMFEADRDVIVFTSEGVALERRSLTAVAEVVACGAGVVDVKHVVADLHGRGLGRILCEGGPSLSRSLFEAGLVDELCLTLSPMLAGEGHHHLGQAWGGAPGQFELVALMEGDGMLLTRYAVAGS
jgi:riboflavin biosynthesis pyrimidine reductase